MPDGDIVHNRLRRLYQKPYQQLCEGKANHNECAKSTLDALKKDLVGKGNFPLILAQNMADRLVRAIGAGKNGSVNFSALSIEFDQLAQQADGRPDLKELTLRAGKSVLRDLRYGQAIEVENASKEILKRYMCEVYESEFKERIPLTSKHHAEIDESTLNRRIEEIQPDIDKAINKWAREATMKASISNLKLPLCQKEDGKIDMEEDLPSDHNHRNITRLLNSEDIEPLQITTQELKKYFSSPYEVILE